MGGGRADWIDGGVAAALPGVRVLRCPVGGSVGSCFWILRACLDVDPFERVKP